ncbi:MAG: cadherin-like domain-containing protein, partial [Colwellia sp.]|nr:cadherin-like domain-containing protein [Colwellia sp.]
VLIEGEQLVYTPAESFFGEALIHFGVDDNNGGTAYGTVTIQVIENQVPQAINDEVSTDDRSTIIIDVLANDSDDDADTLTILTADAEHGVVSITENNTLTYTPLLGYDGIDLIDYTISDGHDGSSDAQVKVTVTAAETIVDKNKSGGGSLGYFILLLSGLAFVSRNIQMKK